MDKPINTQEPVTVKENQNSVSKPTKKKWSTKKIVLVIVGAFVALFLVVFVGANFATSEPLKVSDEYIQYIQDGNDSAAYDLMSSDAQEATSSQDFEAIVDQMEALLTGEAKNTSKEVSAKTGSDPSATVKYEIEGSDSETHLITVNLVQVDGKWQVLNFESIKK